MLRLLGLPGTQLSRVATSVRLADGVIKRPATDVPAVVTVPALLSVATVANLLDCSPRTVRRRIAERSLPAVIDHGRVRVRADDLRAYIDRLDLVGGKDCLTARRRRAPNRYDFLHDSAWS
jgi:excisionase family DNA binding protein